MLYGLLERICKKVELPYGYGEAGGLFLDHQPIYGGWNVRQLDTEGGSGESCPFGLSRVSGTEMHELLRGILFGLNWGE